MENIFILVFPPSSMLNELKLQKKKYEMLQSAEVKLIKYFE